MVSSIHTYIGSKFHIVHPTKSKQKGRIRRRVDSNANFRDLKQICKMGKKKVRRTRRRRLEEEEEKEAYFFFSFLFFFLLLTCVILELT
jgi:hypothetical protein